MLSFFLFLHSSSSLFLFQSYTTPLFHLSLIVRWVWWFWLKNDKDLCIPLLYTLLYIPPSLMPFDESNRDIFPVKHEANIVLFFSVVRPSIHPFISFPLFILLILFSFHATLPFHLDFFLSYSLFHPNLCTLSWGKKGKKKKDSIYIHT